jgi:arylsulfatase A-like enzyme
MMKTSVIASAVAAACMLTSLGPAPAAERRGHERKSVRDAGLSKPNVLIIVTDDQRYDTLAVMPAVRKWFKRRGTEFRRAYATTPLCCPSRSSIFTGRYPHNHGVLINGDGNKLDHDSTLQYYLHEAGYRTALAGKFLNAVRVTKDPPNFDRWAVFNPANSPGYYGAVFNTNGHVAKHSGYSTTIIGKRAVRWLRGFERRDRKPWLMFLTPYGPHAPFNPSREYKAAHVPAWQPNPAVLESDRTDKPAWVQERTLALDKARATATAQMRALKPVDDMVNRVMRVLGKLNERSNTLAIFMSDNGYMWGEHGLAHKRWPYEQSVHVPLLLRWPGHVEKGTVDRRLVANIDVAPTVMQAAELSGAEPQMDGRSLLKKYARKALMLEFFAELKIPSWRALMTRRAIYIEWTKGDKKVFTELYRRKKDRWQLKNRMMAIESTDAVATSWAERLGSVADCKGKDCP